MERRGWFEVLLLVACCVAFGPGLSSPLTHFDDNLYISENPALRVGGLTGLLGMWDSARVWRGEFLEFFPLRDSVYWLLYQVWGPLGTPYHVASLLFHMLASMLVLQLGRKLGLSLWSARAVALLFAVQPVHTESIVWAAGLKDPLYTSLMLAGLLAYQRYRETLRARWYACFLGLLVASLTVKSLAISTVALAFALERWVTPTTDWKRIVQRLVGPSLITGIFLIQFLAIGRANRVSADLHGGLLSHVVLSTWVQAKYLKQALFPTSFRLEYCFEPATAWTDVRFLAGILALSALGIIFALSRKQPLNRIGVVWYLACLFPVSNLFPFPALMADRYLYIAVFGIILLLVPLLERLPSTWRTLTVGGLALFYLGTSAVRSATWQHEDAIWAEVDEDPECQNDPDTHAAMSHLLRAYSSSDPAVRLAAITRGIESRAFSTLKDQHRCEAWCRGALQWKSLGQPERGDAWVAQALKTCPSIPEVWESAFMMQVHRKPADAARSAAVLWSVRRGPREATLKALSRLEADPAEPEDALLATVRDSPEVACPLVKKWATRDATLAARMALSRARCP